MTGMFFCARSGATSARFLPAADHDLHADAIGEGDRVADVGLGVGPRDQRQPAFDDGHERVEDPVGRRGRDLSWRRPARLRQQPLEFVELGVSAPSSAPRRSGSIRGSCGPFLVAAAATAAHQRRKLERDPRRGRTVLSSQVQPSRFITAIWPPRMPPPGVTATVVTPLARVTGIESLSL